MSPFRISAPKPSAPEPVDEAELERLETKWRLAARRRAAAAEILSIWMGIVAAMALFGAASVGLLCIVDAAFGQSDCERRGGVEVEGHRGHVCIDPRALR